MPSLGYGTNGSAPYSRSTFVSLSQNNNCGSPPSGESPPTNSIAPTMGWSTATDRSPAACSDGRLPFVSPHDHVLRNHAVGSTCSVSDSGPALVTWTDISTSSGPDFA